MGFTTGQNVIIPADWQIDQKSTMSAKQKWEDISTYKEEDDCKIIQPTRDIILHLKDKIGYSTPTVRIWSIQNNRLEIITQFSNVIKTRTLYEIIHHFSDTRFQFYLSKVVHQGVFTTYFTQFDNTHNLRDQKLKSIGI
jgi:hypothetical protein